MRRFDFNGGIFLRLGRWWVGVFASFPFFGWVPVIAGGSEGMAAQGTYLLMGNGASPEVFTEVAEVTDLGGPSTTVETIDFTHLRSPGNSREFKNSFINGGDVPFTIQYISDNATHQAVAAKLNVSDPTNFKMVFPDASSVDYAATVTGFGFSGITVGGKITVNVNLKVSGVVDFSGAGA